MTNPFTKKIPHNHAYYLIMIALLLGLTWNWVAKIEAEATQQIVQPAAAQTKAPETSAESTPKAKKGTLMHVTGFSSVECHTSWCKANAGKPRRNLAAINGKYGNVTKVYIAAYDKTYSTVDPDTGKILRTDDNTDLDIWFGDDHDTALTVNTRILVNPIK